MSSSVPPNNLDQLVAWTRIMIEDVLTRIDALEDAVFPPMKKAEKVKDDNTN